MCGIFATTRADLWQDRIVDVLKSLGHRGPDDQGTWVSDDGQVLLAHTRLSVIGLDAAGRQPATSGGGDLVLVFNGEIYNYRQLGARSGRSVPTSDTQVLADLLHDKGFAASSALRGMFAWAAWDSRSASLMVGRDQFGIKPLYLLRHDGGGVSLASELPALLLSPEARRLDPTGLAHYLAFGHTGQSLTLFPSISKIPPGTVFKWTEATTGLLEQTHRIGAADASGDSEASSVVDAIENSVEAHLVSDVEVGIFLSSGVDSTLIASMAARTSPDLRAFTLSFPDSPEMDESPLAALHAAQLGIRHIVCPVSASEIAAAANRFAACHGEPFGDAAALPLTCLAERTSTEVKVVLTGEGADELFGGYGRYRISRLLDRRGVGLLKAVGPHLAEAWARRRSDKPYDRAIEAILWGGGIRSHAALLGSDINAFVSSGLPHARDAADLVAADWFALDGGTQFASAQQYDLRRWLPNVYLEKTDRATMAWSLEARVPFLDIPTFAALGRQPAQTKAVLQVELKHRMPGVRLPTRKKGLAVDLDRALAGDLARHVDYELFAPEAAVTRVLGQQWATELRYRADRSPTLRYRLAMLGLWEDLFSGEVYT
jgi:asparagine synthase (glutamine-hydrolysing)